MATQTTNYGFNKDAATDYYGIDKINANLDLIDKTIKETADSIPATLPANGGDADTVNGHTVESDVPVNAKFTDTVYAHPTTHPASMITGLPTSLPANGGNSDTVDGFRVTTATVIPTSLTTNCICFVHE